MFDARNYLRQERCYYLDRYLRHQINFVLILEGDGLRIGAFGDNLFIATGVIHSFIRQVREYLPEHCSVFTELLGQHACIDA